MIRVMSYVIFGLAFVVLALVFVILHYKNKANLLACSLEATEKEKNEYAKHLARLMNAVDVASENRREADAKVDALHSGDAVDNALDCLRDNKG